MEVAVHETIDRRDRQVETEKANEKATFPVKQLEHGWELYWVQLGHLRQDLCERNHNFILALHVFRKGYNCFLTIRKFVYD